MSEERYRTEIDKVSADEWSALVDNFQDANLYQTWAYGAVRWGVKNLSHLVLKSDSQVIAIAQIRIIRPRFVPGGIAYIRWGPLVHRKDSELNATILIQMAHVLHAEYVVRRGLYLRILPDVFRGSRREELFAQAFTSPRFLRAAPGTVPLERTIQLDLNPPLDELRRRLDQKWRNQLNRAEKNNLEVREGTGIAEYKIFTQLYEEMWQRKQFETSINTDEFGRIFDALPAGSKPRILLCYDQGIPVTGIVCSAMGDRGIYLLGATSDTGLKSKGAYLLQWSMIRWLKQNGVRYYDLGGIDPAGNPGVYHFKNGFSGEDVTRIVPIESCQQSASRLVMRLADFASGRNRLRLRERMKRFMSFRSRT